MFICKSNQVLNNYYNTLFPWLKNCEKEFGFDLEGYGLKEFMVSWQRGSCRIGLKKFRLFNFTNYFYRYK